MVKLVFYIFCISLISSRAHCNLSTWQYSLDYEDPANLIISMGDIVCCIIESSYWSSVYGAEHVMLALDSTSVAHVSANGKNRNRGLLKNDSFMSMTTDSKYSQCRIANSQYDRVLLELGKSPREPESAVSAALSDVGLSVYYDFTGCNCQHWVTKWRYGAAWSVQSSQPPNKYCGMLNVFVNDARASASSYKQNGQWSVRANAGVLENRAGEGVYNEQYLGPNAGAHAEFGRDNIGIGFNLGVGEVHRRLGESVGVTMGVNLNTKLGVGADGVKGMLLGTGIEASRANGFKMCLIGNCVHVG